jgi:hypothetical protein
MKTILRVIFVVMVAIVLSTFSSQAESKEIPAIVNQCIPQQTRQPITRTELIGSTRLQGKEYYLLAAYSQDESTDLIISVTGDRCTEEFFNPMGDPIPLASAVPEAAARSAASTENPTWFAEEVWALQQLGITIPENVQIQQ